MTLAGETGYISKESITKNVAGPEAGNKVKVFVCGKSLHIMI